MSPFAPGLRIHDRFTVERRIGAGGMSEVWRAYDTVLGRPVAVKVLSPRFAAQTLNEARAVARIVDPNIAAIHDYGELPADGGAVPYLVMELVEGEDLAARLQSGPLPWPRAAAVTAQIASGLAAAHRHGVVHRDVKPGNVMLTATGVKLLDFGIAAQAYGPDRGGLIGTPGYAAPERLRPGVPTPASDVYAVGVLLFEMLTGAPPRRYADWEAAQEGWRDPPVLPPLPAVPPRLYSLMAACLAVDPAQRPPASEVARVAGAVAAQPGPATPPPVAGFAAGSARPPAPPTMIAPAPERFEQPAPRSLWPLVWLSLAVVVAVAIGLIYIATRPSGTPTTHSSSPAEPSPAAASRKPSPSPSPEDSPQAVLDQFEQALSDAEDSDEVSGDAADEIRDKVRNVRDHLDDKNVDKRVRDVTKKIDDLVDDGDLDPAVAERLKQILAPLGGD